MSKVIITWALHNTVHGLQNGIVYGYDKDDNKFKNKPDIINKACLEHLVDLVGVTMINSSDKAITPHSDGTFEFSYSERDPSSDEGYNATEVLYTIV